MDRFTIGPRHYHITAGMPGCMPNYTAIAATKRDAETEITYYANGWRDAGHKTDGRARDGRIDCDDTYEYVEHTGVCFCDLVVRCNTCGTLIDAGDIACWCCGVPRYRSRQH